MVSLYRRIGPAADLRTSRRNALYINGGYRHEIFGKMPYWHVLISGNRAYISIMHYSTKGGSTAVGINPPKIIVFIFEKVIANIFENF